MALLKDSTVTGSLSVTDTLSSMTGKFQILKIPNASNGTTYTAGSVNNLIKSNGSSVYWATLDASDIPNLSTSKLTDGTLVVGRGGTGTSTTPSAWGIIYASSTSAYASTAAGTSGQYLKSNGTAAPTWATFSNATVGLGNVTNDAQITKSTFTGANQIMYSTGASAPTVLAANTSSTKKFLRMTGTGSAGAAPAWDTVTKGDVGLGSVENTALSTWAGTSNITTLGTITTGTWSATAIAANKGGTGQTAYTIGDILYCGTANTLSKLSGNTTTTRKFLRSVAATSGTAVAPAWDTVTKTDVGLSNVENTALSTWTGTNKITTVGTISTGTWQGTAIAASYIGNLSTAKLTSGTLGVARGGTGAETFTTNAVLYGNGTSAIGAKASANGALYATAANGTLSWGTLPIAQGGTGGTSAKAAKANFGLGTQNENFRLASTTTAHQMMLLAIDVDNADNTTYNGKTVYFGVNDNAIFAYDAATSSSIWSQAMPVTVEGIGAAPASHTHGTLYSRTSLTKGTNPSTSTYALSQYAYQTGTGTSNSDILFGLNGYVGTDGMSHMRLMAYRYSTTDSDTANIIETRMAADGTRSYYVSAPAAFRDAIGAGTSSLEIGTTSTTAAAGNHNHDGTYFKYSLLTGITNANSTTLIGQFFAQANACSNLPTSAAGVYYHVVCFGYAQFAMQYSSSGMTKMYARYYTNSQWYPWKMVGPAYSTGLPSSGMVTGDMVLVPIS